MTSKSQLSSRLVKFINQLMETLKEERTSVDRAVDECIQQIQMEVDGFLSGSHDKQATCEEISNRLQQAITFFISKSEEFSGLMLIANESNESTTSLQSSVPSTCTEVGSRSSQSMTMGATTVEETLLSLKLTMEQLQEKQEHLDKTFKDVSNQQENFNKEIEILTNANLRSQKKLKERLTAVEKTSLESSTTVDNLNKVFSVNVDARINRLEEENKSVNASLNEFNKQMSSLRSCSNDVITSTQDLSKRVESADQHYNEVSDKLNQLEISLNLLSSQYKEQFEHVCSVNKEKIDDCIGTVCQLLAKRLNQLEKLNETFNKKLNSIEKLSKVEDIETQMAKLADVVKDIGLKSSHPNVGFNAIVSNIVKNTDKVVNVSKCYNLDPSLMKGIPLDRAKSILKSNYGHHFDTSNGTFTSPLKGLYLISLRTSPTENNKCIRVKCCLRATTQRNDDEPILICVVGQNSSITQCIELEAGDELYLTARTTFKDEMTSVDINFSCCMING